MRLSPPFAAFPCVLACLSLLFMGPVAAVPIAVNDSYTATEDTPFTPTGPPVVNGTFNSGADGFTYADDTFGTTNPNNATGSVNATRGVGGGGCLLVDIGRRTNQPRATSGGYSRGITLASAGSLEIRFDYRLRLVGVQSTGFTNRYGEAVFTMDGTREGSGPGDSLARLTAPDDDNPTLDSDWQQASFTLNLSAGLHTMVLGAYSNSTSGSSQYVETLYDNVTVIVAGSGSVLNNDTGGVAPVTAARLTNPANGAVSFGSNGNFTYTPNPNFNGPDTFTYRASDSTGNSNTATVTMNVTPVNDAPAGATDAYTTAEDTPLTVAAPGVLANDSDVDNAQASLVASGSTQPANGTVTGNPDGSFTYTPRLNFTGVDSFTYTVSDGTATSAPVTVNVTVTPLPDAPIAVADEYSTSASVPLVVNLTSSGAGTTQTLIQAAPDTPAGGTAQPGDLWRYLDNGTNQGTAWRDPLFNDASWKTGRGELGYGDGEGGEDRPEFTVIEDNPTPGYNANDDDRYITTYFRKTFTVDDARKLADAQMTLLRDDGAVVFLNGNRIYYDNGLDGATYLTTTPGSTPNEATHITVPLPNAAQYFVEGDNVLAVEIHQAQANSSDLSFDLGFTAIERPFAGVLANDVEPEGQPMTAELVTSPAHGALTFNPNGTFTYTPQAGYQGPDGFTYRATDGTLTSPPVTVSLTVTPPVNQAPVANANSYATNEDVVLNIAGSGVLTNDSDFENAPLTAVLASNPASGAVTLNANGSFTYTPTLNFNGTDSFSYRASDGFKLSAPALVTITVNSVPDPPTAVADTYRTTIGTPLIVSATAPGGTAPLTLITEAPETPVGGPAQAGDLWRYLDNGTDQGSAWRDIDFDDSAWKEGYGELGYGDISDSRPEFTVVEDNATPGYVAGEGGRYMTTYFRKAFAVADRTRLSAMSISLLRDDGAVIWLNGNRVLAEGSLDTASLNYLTAADNTSNEATHETINLPGAASFLVDGTNVLAVEIHQNTSSSSDVSFDLGLTVTESSYAGVLANDTDAEGNTFTASIATAPTRGALTLNPNGTFTYTPSAGYSGTDTFTYRATDASGPSAPATVSIIISSGPNQKPAAVADNFTVVEDVLYTRIAPGVLANDTDPEDDALTALLVTPPTHGALTLNANGSFTYLSALNYHGPDSFTYRAKDSGNLQSSPATVNLTVNPSNDGPAAAADAYATEPGVNLSVPSAQGLLVNDTDIDGNQLSAQIISNPSAGSLTLFSDGGFFYVPGPLGTYTFSYAAYDGTAASPPATVTIIVNGRPVAAAESYSTAEDSPLTVTAANGVLKNDTDPEGATLTATLVTPPQHGSLSLAADGSFTYTPATNYAGADTFAYTAEDGSRSSLPATVSLTVTPVNDAPVAVADAFSVLKDSPLTTTAASGVLKNDTDVENSALTASLVNTTLYGTLTLNPDGSFTYTPQTGFLGEDTFSYRSSDGSLQSGVATVTLTVTAVADTIVISEIMFNPTNGVAGEEFIEVHNYGTFTADLSAWQFTAGVNFTFPSPTVVPAGGRLVIPANRAAFDARWPGVSNRLNTGWGTAASLSNSGETLRLERPDFSQPGEMIEVDQVDYSDEGDWAVRQAETVGNNTGWRWNTGTDGGGHSLQLRNHLLSNNRGQNWLSATPTPGTANTAAASSDLAPLILDVKHSPAFPSATQQVHVTCELEDEATSGHSAKAWWRLAEANPLAFTEATMFDDGLHNDGAPGDGNWGAALPAQNGGSIVEFYVEASDGTRSRTWPAPALNASGAAFLSQAASANCFYQVDQEVWSGTQPLYRLIMSRPEGDAFVATSYDKGEGSDTDKNVTAIFASGTETSIRYQAGVRYRGAGSRGSYRPHNWKLNLPHDVPWNDWTNFNLNSLSAHALVLGSRLMQAAGLPTELGTAAAVRMNGSNRMVSGNPSGVAVYGLYSHQTPMGSEWADVALAGDPGGNIYKKGRGGSGAWRLRESAPGVPNIAGYQSDGWNKETNVTENDWTDLNNFLTNIRLATSNTTTPPSFDYALGSTVADLEQWARWWAFCVIINHRETNLSNGVEDDYSLYIRKSDRKVMLLAHDFDTILSAGDTSTSATATIWQAYDPSFVSEKTFAAAGLDIPRALFFNNRFVRHFKFHLRDLLTTVFAQPNFDATMESALSVSTGAAPWVPQSERTRLKTFMDARRAYILGLLPTAFTATTSLTLTNGLLTTAAANDTGLSGTMDGALTDRVLINGVPAVMNNHDNTWTATGIAAVLQPGVNNVLVQALDESGKLLASQTFTILYDDASVATKGGTLAANETWSAAGGPYQVTSTLNIPSGRTLTIAAGASVYLASGVSLNVAPGGRLVADGTPDRMIRFSRPPGTAGMWGGIVTDGATEARISYAIIEHNGGTAIRIQNNTVATFDHLTFLNNTRASLQLDGSSFMVSHCTFPAMAAGSSFVTVSGSGGITSGGRGIIRDCTFGAAQGNNDVVDFTGGNRPGPVLRVLNCVFEGSGDDVLDLDGTDAWIEGNLFMHVHKNGATDGASAVSGGAAGGQQSQVTLIRNLIYDCDNAVTMKQGNSFALLYNTIVRITRTGGTESQSGVVNFAETTDGTQSGAGGVLIGNIIHDVESLTRQYYPGTNNVTFTDNILPVAWSGPGSGNSVMLDALLNLSLITTPATATAAQVRAALAPQQCSPAVGNGYGGNNKGASFPEGIAASGVPLTPTGLNSVTLVIGPSGSFSGTNPWSFGYTHYRFSTNGTTYSSETPVAAPLSLTSLANGLQTIYLQGKDDTGTWQTTPTVLTWTVNAALPTIMISEVLANNVNAYPLGATRPDVIELHNYGPSAVSLAGFGLTDDAADFHKFPLPSPFQIPAGGYLLIMADSLPSQSGELHTGFGLDAGGETLSLFSPAGTLVDAVTFGSQIPDRSIARTGARRTWSLATFTPAAANTAWCDFGPPAGLRLNEWLAANDFIVDADFIEIFNPSPKPVDMSGMMLTDNFANLAALRAAGDESVHVISPLSFIAGSGFVRFLADGDAEKGGDHLSFKLSQFHESLALATADGTKADHAVVSTAREDVSEGRSTDGGLGTVFFIVPTPGFSNTADLSAESDLRNSLRITELMYNPAGSAQPEFIEFKNIGAATLDLNGVTFASGITFTFPAMSLAPGAYAVITASSDAARFAASFPAVPLAGTYAGKLDNSGERLRYELAGLPIGILDFEYADSWYPITDGDGASLQIVDATRLPGTWDERESWQPGAPSPGTATAFGIIAGADQRVTFPSPAVIDGTLFTGGIAPGSITVAWSKVRGPGTVNFTAPANADTNATFSQPGTYELKVTATAPGPVTALDTVIITAEESYDAWALRMLAASPAADRLKTADPDRDGLPNVAEYVLATSPSTADADRAATLKVIDGQLVLEYHRYAAADAAITITPEISQDLTTWQSDSFSVVTALESESGGIETWLAADPDPIIPGRTKFLRLKIVAP